MYILLVEPDVLLAKTYTAMLKKQGNHVYCAQTGQAAIEAADSMPQVDAVLLEVQLPGLNGVAFLQELRSYSDLMNVPVIINSYMHRPSDEESKTVSETFGVTQWLYKPTTTLKKLEQAISMLEIQE